MMASAVDERDFLSGVNVVRVDPDELKKLRNMNLGLAALHLITGIILAIITDTNSTAPSYTNFPNTLRGKPSEWAPVPERKHEVAVGYFSAIFLLLAGVDHLIVATVGKSLYELYLTKAMNPFRWAEYSVSASFMHVQIAMLSGIFDIHLLVCIFGLTMCTMVFGYQQEWSASRFWGRPERKSHAPFWFGWIPHVFNWSVILCFFFYTVSKGSPPKFVWAIIFILFILDASFAVNFYLQQKEIGKWNNYLYGEWGFCILSLSAKQLLAWINYGGSRSLKTQ